MISERDRKPVARVLPGALSRQARKLARRCKYEASHSEHVRALAVSLYDQLCAKIPRKWARSARERELLDASAILHDAGAIAGQARHHLTGQSIALHNDIQGCTADEQRLISVVVRFHRKAPPTLADPVIQTLPLAMRKSALRLIAILRAADGLDRSHQQLVRRVTFGRSLKHKGDTGSVALWNIQLHTDKKRDGVKGNQLRAEQRGFARKSDLLVEMVGSPITLTMV
jgi:exopolyphosphatase/guanosine-5'-triphosphate,3'-diphosphate pyrophosphatase